LPSLVRMGARLRGRIGEVALAIMAVAGPALVLLAGAASLALVLLLDAAYGAVTVDHAPAPVRRVQVTASRYQFTPAQIEVQQGGTVCSDCCGSGHERMRGELVVAERSR